MKELETIFEEFSRATYPDSEPGDRLRISMRRAFYMGIKSAYVHVGTGCDIDDLRIGLVSFIAEVRAGRA